MDDAQREQWKTESAIRFVREQIEQRERSRELRVGNGTPPSEPSSSPSPPRNPNQRDPFPSFPPDSNTPLRTTVRKGSRYVSLGDRLSYEGALCTVRYIGWVEGTEKGLTWFGVEWDDRSRGKHNGSHKGKVYFTCKSPSPTAASFVRYARNLDPSRSFVQAVKRKYADQDPSLGLQNVISGKVVEEVGFEKISEQQKRLHELKIVLVDGQQIEIAEDEGDEKIESICPSIIELDLSRNLFKFAEVLKIVSPGKLSNLKSLKLNGNHFSESQAYWNDGIFVESARWPGGSSVVELHIDDVLLNWQHLCNAARPFDRVTIFSASSNYLNTLDCPLPVFSLKSLTLDHNEFSTLFDLIILRQCSSLETLRLKGNKISSIDKEPYVLTAFHRFGDKLRYVDLSYNAIASWKFVDDLDYCLPGLTSLRMSHNPLYATSQDSEASGSADEGWMLTLARFGKLTGLNFSNITKADRSNAEMFYLSRIARAIAEVPENDADSVVVQHKRYAELCEKYGAPTIVRRTASTINPRFLEARLIKFTFYLQSASSDREAEKITLSKEIPKSFDVYRVKGIVGKIFGIPPLSLRLIWETGEWDPVAGYEEQEDSSDDEEDEEEKIVDPENQDFRDKARWMKREVEVEESTRLIGNYVDGLEATVRVERRRY